MPPRIYLDSCCLNRLTDDQTQPRIRAESAAIEDLLQLVSTGQLLWLASDVLRLELQRNPNADKRTVALDFLTLASEFAHAGESTFHRASTLVSLGFGPMDALHLALAGECRAQWLLSVDDRFIALAVRASKMRLPSDPTTLPSVLNPVDWFNRRSQWHLQPQSTRPTE